MSELFKNARRKYSLPSGANYTLRKQACSWLLGWARKSSKWAQATSIFQYQLWFPGNGSWVSSLETLIIFIILKRTVYSTGIGNENLSELFKNARRKYSLPSGANYTLRKQACSWLLGWARKSSKWAQATSIFQYQLWFPGNGSWVSSLETLIIFIILKRTVYSTGIGNENLSELFKNARRKYSLPSGANYTLRKQACSWLLGWARKSSKWAQATSIFQYQLWFPGNGSWVSSLETLIIFIILKRTVYSTGIGTVLEYRHNFQPEVILGLNEKY